MFGNEQRLSNVLIENNLLTYDEFKEVENIAKEKNISVEEVILENSYLTDEELARAISKQHDYPYIGYDEIEIDLDLIRNMNPHVMISNNFLPFNKNDKFIDIACLKPADISLSQILKKAYPNTKYNFKIASKSTIKKLLYKIENNASLQEIIRNVKKELEMQTTDDKNEPAISQLLRMIIKTSIQRGASDIHVEPHGKNMLIRARIDGRLQELFQIEKEIYPVLVSRMKLESNLNMSERKKPQDGRFSMKIEDGLDGFKEYDFRTSFLPLDGQGDESVVFRILDKSKTMVSLDDLGFSEGNVAKFKKAIKEPNGLVFVTGPTGSGKTTTLYAGVNALKNMETKIITVEDPIEYKIIGVQQSQVDKKQGRTFEAILRSILRQDPDIIMVGESRDLETLSTAIEAGLTGHLVFTTLHTNDAPSAILRIIDMGIEPMLVSTATVAIQAQRLIRVVCKHCSKEVDIAPKVLNEIKQFTKVDMEGVKFRKGEGCLECNQTGYKGRTIISEVLEINPELESYINTNGDNLDVQEIIKIAKENDFEPMIDSAVLKAIGGETSIDEILRIVKMG